jgi:hypothetical protein
VDRWCRCASINANKQLWVVTVPLDILPIARAMYCYIVIELRLIMGEQYFQRVPIEGAYSYFESAEASYERDIICMHAREKVVDILCSISLCAICSDLSWH